MVEPLPTLESISDTRQLQQPSKKYILSRTQLRLRQVKRTRDQFLMEKGFSKDSAGQVRLPASSIPPPSKG